MSYPVYMPATGHALAERIDDEVRAARKKFPSSEAAFTALVEEVGELAKALLDETGERVVAEAVQVAAMAIRIATEGDPTLDAYRQKRGMAPLARRPGDKVQP